MTPITDVYDNFLSKISDYTLLSDTVTQSDIDDQLFGYFRTARTRFYRCKNSLDTVVDDVTGDINFTVDLNYFEVEILATLMLVEYIKPQIITSQTLRQALGDKDFAISSQASQLRELRLLQTELRAEASKLITEYTYLDLESFDENAITEAKKRKRSIADGKDANIGNYWTGNKATGQSGDLL